MTGVTGAAHVSATHMGREIGTAQLKMMKENLELQGAESLHLIRSATGPPQRADGVGSHINTVA